MASTDVIQGLWIGKRLSAMQRLSIRSFLAHGHQYHLYTYGDVGDVPAGVQLANANAIIPEAKVFRNINHDTFAAFSDFFRYKLLLDRGGWWADLDLICLRPFDFEAEYVFSSEYEIDKTNLDLSHPITEGVNSGVIKAPRGAPVISEAWVTCCSKSPQQLGWGEIGPLLVRQLVPKYGLSSFVKPAITFCPIPYFMLSLLFDPTVGWIMKTTVYAIHLWHELWRRNNIDVNATYHPDCLYEQLKRRYL
jgi:glycosyl transferase-like sugar-binding protein